MLLQAETDIMWWRSVTWHFSMEQKHYWDGWPGVPFRAWAMVNFSWGISESQPVDLEKAAGSRRAWIQRQGREHRIKRCSYTIPFIHLLKHLSCSRPQHAVLYRKSKEAAIIYKQTCSDIQSHLKAILKLQVYLTYRYLVLWEENKQWRRTIESNNVTSFVLRKY